jgi:hypothetical protein
LLLRHQRVNGREQTDCLYSAQEKLTAAFLLRHLADFLRKRMVHRGRNLDFMNMPRKSKMSDGLVESLPSASGEIFTGSIEWNSPFSRYYW